MRDFGDFSGPQIDRKRKQIIVLFKECELSITVEINFETVDYRYVFFNFTKRTFNPYRKPNDLHSCSHTIPFYIHVNSNHPLSIMKEIPKSISKRIFNIASSEEIFDNATSIYQVAFASSSFDMELNTLNAENVE